MRWAADVTDRQVRQLTRLVDELLDVARISQGKVVLQTQCLDLVTLVSQWSLQRGTIARRHQTLSTALPGISLNLNGDATRLSQVVNNLLLAAIKARKGGALSVSVACADREDGEFAVLEVSDNGIGIDAELLPHVFELFEQGKRALDRTQGGLGVGLTLVKRLVTLHGGEVVAQQRRRGLGAQFRDDATVPGRRCGADCPKTARRLPGAAVRRHILLVDDNVDVVETTRCCSLSGPRGAQRQDGLQATARELRRSSSPRSYLLDIGLPLLDGYEVARRLRQMQVVGAPSTALTGYGQQGDRERRRDAEELDRHMLNLVDPHALAQVIDG